MAAALPHTRKTAGLNCDTERLGLPPSGSIWRLHDAAVVVLLLLLLYQVLRPALVEPNFGIQLGHDGAVTIRDFAAHVTYAQAFWSAGADYSVVDHLGITDRWAGQPVGRALPFGYSPTMLWLLGPLCVLPTVWAYFAWSGISAIAVWWMTRRERSLCLIGALVLLSPLGIVCLALGQTALLSAAALMWLMLRQFPASDRASAAETWSWSLATDVALLWLLTAKPPLALVAGAALLAARRWRTVSVAVAVTALTTLALTPLLGADWWVHYLNMMTNYDRDTADTAFAWSLRPDHMSNLRSIFGWTATISDSLACRMSSIVWLTAMAVTVGLGVCRRLPLGCVWALNILSYLLFCSHVTSTEDLHLVLLVPLLAVGRRMSPYGWAAIALVLGVSFLAPGGLLPVGPERSVMIFAAKLMLAGLALHVLSTEHRQHPLNR